MPLRLRRLGTTCYAPVSTLGRPGDARIWPLAALRRSRNVGRLCGRGPRPRCDREWSEVHGMVLWAGFRSPVGTLLSRGEADIPDGGRACAIRGRDGDRARGGAGRRGRAGEPAGHRHRVFADRVVRAVPRADAGRMDTGTRWLGDRLREPSRAGYGGDELSQ